MLPRGLLNWIKNKMRCNPVCVLIYRKQFWHSLGGPTSERKRASKQTNSGPLQGAHRANENTSEDGDEEEQVKMRPYRPVDQKMGG